MTPQRVLVVATAGRAVPMESSPSIITDTPCAVILSYYYRRRIALGELQVVDAPAEAPAPHADVPKVLPGTPELNSDREEPRIAPNPDQDSTPSRRRAAP